jgi:hypothetical protein
MAITIFVGQAMCGKADPGYPLIGRYRRIYGRKLA